MGVAGLWEVLRPAGQVRSLTELAVEDGFNANPAHQRGFRIGIDASIWFFHAAYGREGENPELRTLFFRCCRLLQTPLLPLFVFDGPNRPAIKRGKRVGGNAHWLTQGMKNIIDAFGFEWRVAPGEAEAELAYLNRTGIIDAVLSDDVDNFLFGATMVIRNPSNTLSGNRAHPVKNAQGKDDGNHVVTYKADAILFNPSVALSRSGTILIGLLSGGDYIPAGLPGCGQKFATGLARAGFGDSLVKAVQELKGARLDAFLDQWKQDVKNELKTNKSGLLPSKKPSLATSIPDDFPSLPVLMSYANPLTSENTPQRGNRKTQSVIWKDDPDPMRIASLCELYFEWGVKDVIVQRFRTVLWPGIVCRAVRRAAVNQDIYRRPSLVGPGREEANRVDVGPSSPSKRLSATLSTLSLSSPSKKFSASGSSGSDPSISDSFTLSSLVPLTYPPSASSSRSTSPTSPTSSGSRRSPLLLEVLSQRAHVSTDSTLEYRVLIDPTALVERTESGVKGIRPPLVGGLFGVDSEEDGDEGTSSDNDMGGTGRLETAAAAASRPGVKKRKARQEVPTKPLRLWLPACMIRAAAPALVEAYDERVRIREEKKAKHRTKGGQGRRVGTRANSASRRTKVKSDADDSGDESTPGPSSNKKTARSKAEGNATRTGVGRCRRKLKQASEAQDEAYEFIDLSAGGSPCSSGEECVEESTKVKGKARVKTKQTEATKPTKKANAKIDMTNRKAATTETTKDCPNATKPPTMRTKISTSKALRRVYEEEEEDSTDVTMPPPLPKSSRPLDLLRAKSKAGTGPTNPTSKSQSKSVAAPTYEEEESTSSSPSTRPSGSRHNAPSLPHRDRASKATKKPLFVDVSDTDSDIEVSDIRRPLPGTTASITTYSKDDNASGSVGVSKSPTTFLSEENTDKGAGGVADLAAITNSPRSMGMPSTLILTASFSPVRLVSAPLETNSIRSTSIVRSPSKLARILLPQPVSESEVEEGSEQDKLPTFHRGSAKSRKNKEATVIRPAPRPFPMQFALKSPVSPCTLKYSEGVGRNSDGDGDGNGVEIVDVFTTPRGPSPPRSPTPSPSPVKLPSLTGSSAFVKSRQSNGFPISPTKSKWQAGEEPRRRTKQWYTSSEPETAMPREERESVLKSPRKSVGHSSPRHVSGARGRASPLTPLALPASSESAQMGGVVRKHRLSDTSAIYISSGSEEEGIAGLNVDHVREEVNEDRGESTDRGTDTWVDRGMILSAPPSPAPADDASALAPEEVAFPNPARGPKFKPAPTAAPKVYVHSHAPDETTSRHMTSAEGIALPGPSRPAPLLVARARRSKVRDNDIIDLTSD